MIATFLLVFVTCGSAALSTRDEHMVSRLGASVAGGLIVTVMIYAVRHVSGAHMNAAVTLAFATVSHFPWKQVPFYAAAQLTGATVSSFMLRGLLHPIKKVGTTSPCGSDVQALIMEITVTFSMMFVTSALALADIKARGELSGIAVGSVLCITSILAGWFRHCYELVRVIDQPVHVHAISQKLSSTFELGQSQSDDEVLAATKDHFNTTNP